MPRYNDLNVPKITVIGIISALITFAFIVAVQALYYQAAQVETEHKIIDAPTPEANSLVAEQQIRLTQYGWLNRENGQVSIPIDQAMTAVVRELSQPKPDSSPAERSDKATE